MAEPSGSEEERGFQALLEKVEDEVKAYGEQVISLGEKIDRIANAFDRRLTALDEKVDLHTRTILAKMDTRSEDLIREIRVLGSRLNVHERTHLG